MKTTISITTITEATTRKTLEDLLEQALATTGNDATINSIVKEKRSKRISDNKKLAWRKRPSKNPRRWDNGELEGKYLSKKLEGRGFIPMEDDLSMEEARLSTEREDHIDDLLNWYDSFMNKYKEMTDEVNGIWDTLPTRYQKLCGDIITLNYARDSYWCGIKDLRSQLLEYGIEV